MPSQTEIKAQKAEVVKKFGRKGSDTGSPEVQIALLTDRINHLNGHFKTHKQDKHSRLGLLKLVGKRRRLLDYLKQESLSRYSSLIKTLEIRK